MTFEQALIKLSEGYRIRLPEWIGYWFLSDDKIKVFTRTGDILDTPNLNHHEHRNDWTIVEEGLGFEFAILALQAGKKVRKTNWGADVYLQLQVPDEHSKMTHPYIYVTSRFGRVPWVATQVEMLAKDWTIFQ